jgi:dihydropteroate synthase
VLLRESARHAALGYPLLLSASNKRFLGELLDLDIDDRRAESLGAAAYGVLAGCRVVRVHDVAGTVRVCRVIEAILSQAQNGGGGMPQVGAA